MSTPPETTQPPARANRADGALVEALSTMRPGWIVLRDCELPGGEDGKQARVRYVLLHPATGIALLDLLPGSTVLGAADRLRLLLDAAGFRRAFGDFPPIVYLCVPSRTLPDLESLLAEAFDRVPPIALRGGRAWAGYAQQALAGGEVAGASAWMADAPDEAAMEPDPPPRRGFDLGLRGLAVFWGVVASVFGGGGVVLQALGPPDEMLALARAAADAPRPPWTSLDGRPATAPGEAPLRPPSPGPVLAFWPPERLAQRFDAAQADTGVHGADDSTGADPTSAGDHSAPPVGGAADDQGPTAAAESVPAPAPIPDESARARAGDGAPAAPPDPTFQADAPAGNSPRETQPATAAENDAGQPAPAERVGAAGASAPAPGADRPPALTGGTGADTRPLLEAIDSATGPDAPTIPPAHGGAATGQSPAPEPPPFASPAPSAAGAEPFVGAAPTPPATMAAPLNEQAPPVAAVEPVRPGDRQPGEGPAETPPPRVVESGEPAATPARSVATESPAVPNAPPAPALGNALPGSAVDEAAGRPGAAAPTAARRDPQAPDAEAAQPGAGVPVARPAIPEPDRREPARAEERERRAPAAATAAPAPPAPTPSAPGPSTPVSPALADALIARGDAMVARRDISAARLLYERAAAGDARAASALARTYDPAFLAEIGVQGIRGDAALATAWYRKAVSLGDGAAAARVEALNRATR